MSLGVVTADFGLEMKVETGTALSAVSLTVSGSVYAHIGDASFGASTTMGFTSIVGQSAITGSFQGSLSCTDCSKILDDITDYIKNSIWLQISDLFSGEYEVEDVERRSRPWAGIKKVVAHTRKSRKGTAQLQDTDAQLEEELQTAAKNSWSVKKAVKKASKTVASTVVDTTNTVTDTITAAAEAFASLADWGDIEPTLSFSTPELDGGIDGWKLKVSLTVTVGTVTESITASVDFSVGDMGDAITEAITDAFSAVESSFSSVWDSRRRRRRL